MDGVNEFTLVLLRLFISMFGECYINLIFKEVEDIQIGNPHLPLLFILIIEIGRRMLRKIKKRSFHFVQERDLVWKSRITRYMNKIKKKRPAHHTRRNAVVIYYFLLKKNG